MQKNRFRKTENTRNGPFRIKCSSWNTHYRNEKKRNRDLHISVPLFYFIKIESNQKFIFMHFRISPQS